MLMTIHHIEGKSKIYSFYDKQLMNVEMYKHRYSLKLATIAMVDMIEKIFRESIYEFD